MTRWPEGTVADRFWSKVDRSGEHWFYTGTRQAPRDPRGLPRFVVRRGEVVLVDRYAWQLFYRMPPPKGIGLVQSCAAPRCIRPEHRKPMTQAAHAREQQATGECPPPPANPGEDNPNARLTEEQVLYIRRANESREALAAMFEVCVRHVYNIRARKAWTHLP